MQVDLIISEIKIAFADFMISISVSAYDQNDIVVFVLIFVVSPQKME